MKTKEVERARESNGGKICVFDLMRALACIGIVVHHFLYHPTRAGIFIYSGIPMEIFFFVSGFLIPMSLENCNIKQFLIKRFFRLIPVLWLAVLIHCVVLCIFNLDSIVSNLFLIGDLVKKHEFVRTSWSLKVEIKFYLICALSFFLFKDNRKRFYCMLFLYLSLCTFAYCFEYTAVHDFIKLRYVIQLTSGCFIASAYYFYTKKYISKKEFIISSLILFAMLLFQKNFTTFRLNTNSIHYCCGYLISLFLCIKCKNLGNNVVIKYIANISYSLYLFHMLFMDLSFRFVDGLMPDFLRHSVAYMFFYELIILIPCACMCHFIYKYIEKPAYDFGRKLALRLK